MGPASQWLNVGVLLSRCSTATQQGIEGGGLTDAPWRVVFCLGVRSPAPAPTRACPRVQIPTDGDAKERSVLKCMEAYAGRYNPTAAEMRQVQDTVAASQPLFEAGRLFITGAEVSGFLLLCCFVVLVCV